MAVFLLGATGHEGGGFLQRERFSTNWAVI